MQGDRGLWGRDWNLETVKRVLKSQYFCSVCYALHDHMTVTIANERFCLRGCRHRGAVKTNFGAQYTIFLINTCLDFLFSVKRGFTNFIWRQSFIIMLAQTIQNTYSWGRYIYLGIYFASELAFLYWIRTMRTKWFLYHIMPLHVIIVLKILHFIYILVSICLTDILSTSYVSLRVAKLNSKILSRSSNMIFEMLMRQTQDVSLQFQWGGQNLAWQFS